MQNVLLNHISCHILVYVSYKIITHYLSRKHFQWIIVTNTQKSESPFFGLDVLIKTHRGFWVKRTEERGRETHKQKINDLCDWQSILMNCGESWADCMKMFCRCRSLLIWTLRQGEEGLLTAPRFFSQSLKSSKTNTQRDIRMHIYTHRPSPVLQLFFSYTQLRCKRWHAQPKPSPCQLHD